MTPPLETAVRRVQRETGADKVFLLPFPYLRGHFRLYGQYGAVTSEAFLFCERQGLTYVTLREDYLAELCCQAEEEAPPLCPEDSTLETLLKQILSHGFAPGGCADPFLLRMSLDFGREECLAPALLGDVEKRLGSAYAQALRRKDNTSLLPVVARRLAWGLRARDAFFEPKEDKLL